ncbi:MAG: hypothetical protein ACI9R3_002895 [Verrucomicrobiales bacterium]|jgi:hypothetical protein
MKPSLILKRSFPLCATAVAALFFSSCASTVQSRIEKNASQFSSLTPKQQELVQQGKIDRGMPKSGVFLAWGRPDHVTRGNRDGKEFEAWRYRAYEPVYTQSIGISIGPGYGRYGRYGHYPECGYGTDVYYRPFTAARVDFHKNRVTGWESVK